MAAFTDLISPKFSTSVIESLAKPIEEAKLLAAAQAMALNKSPSPNGFAIQFFTKYWNFLGADFAQMLRHAHQSGCLPGAMNKGLIILLHKNTVREELDNWRPITLLNVAYKILAKTLQRC
jgi:hypothetical protein